MKTSMKATKEIEWHFGWFQEIAQIVADCTDCVTSRSTFVDEFPDLATKEELTFMAEIPEKPK